MYKVPANSGRTCSTNAQRAAASPARDNALCNRRAAVCLSAVGPVLRTFWYVVFEPVRKPVDSSVRLGRATWLRRFSDRFLEAQPGLGTAWLLLAGAHAGPAPASATRQPTREPSVCKLQLFQTRSPNRLAVWSCWAVRPIRDGSGIGSPYRRNPLQVISLRRPPIFTPSASVGVTRRGNPCGCGSVPSGSMPISSYRVPIRSHG